MSERPRNVRVYMVTHRFVGCFGVRKESRDQSQPSVDPVQEGLKERSSITTTM